MNYQLDILLESSQNGDLMKEVTSKFDHEFSGQIEGIIFLIYIDIIRKQKLKINFNDSQVFQNLSHFITSHQIEEIVQNNDLMTKVETFDDLDKLYNEVIVETEDDICGLNLTKDLISTEEDIREDNNIFANLIIPDENDKNNFSEVINKIQSNNYKFGEGNANFFIEIISKNFQKKLNEKNLSISKIKKKKKEDILFDFSNESLSNKREIFIENKFLKLVKKTINNNLKKYYITKIPLFYNFQQE